jgi:hypothetical protein
MTVLRGVISPLKWGLLSHGIKLLRTFVLWTNNAAQMHALARKSY